MVAFNRSRDAEWANRQSMEVVLVQLVTDTVQLDHRAVIGIGIGLDAEPRNLLAHRLAHDGTRAIAAHDEIETLGSRVARFWDIGQGAGQDIHRADAAFILDRDEFFVLLVDRSREGSQDIAARAGPPRKPPLLRPATGDLQTLEANHPLVEVGTGIDVAQGFEPVPRDIDGVGAIRIESRRHFRMGVPLENNRPNAAAGERYRRHQPSWAASRKGDPCCRFPVVRRNARRVHRVSRYLWARV